MNLKLENRKLPENPYKEKKEYSYGYASALYLMSLVVTILSFIVIIMVDTDSYFIQVKNIVHMTMKMMPKRMLLKLNMIYFMNVVLKKEKLNDGEQYLVMIS